MSDEPDGGEPDGYDRATRLTGFADVSRRDRQERGRASHRRLAVPERRQLRLRAPYAHDVADDTHSQYRPDFFYPDVDLWHEHWALRADGTPPESFTGYAESMQWKKQLHEQFGTTLVETKWHEIIDLSGFETLAKDLTGHGLDLDWNPDRPIPGASPLEHERLARLVRTFMSHVKSGSLTREDLDARLLHGPKRASPRTRLFLDLYWRIHDRGRLTSAPSTRWTSTTCSCRRPSSSKRDPGLARFELVMVDEFQDTSQARARLTKALLQAAGSTCSPWAMTGRPSTASPAQTCR